MKGRRKWVELKCISVLEGQGLEPSGLWGPLQPKLFHGSMLVSPDVSDPRKWGPSAGVGFVSCPIPWLWTQLLSWHWWAQLPMDRVALGKPTQLFFLGLLDRVYLPIKNLVPWRRFLPSHPAPSQLRFYCEIKIPRFAMLCVAKLAFSVLSVLPNPSVRFGMSTWT